MTLAKFALDYDKYDEADLEAFLRARGLGQTKADLVQRLRQADLESTFRFLDLPGELRNRIYCEVLRLRNQPMAQKLQKYRFTGILVSYPQIFRCSRQVHAEASGILYGDNEGIITLRARVCQKTAMGTVEHSSRCPAVPRTYFGRRENIFLTPGSNGAWSNALLKFHRVRIDISLSITRIYYTRRDIQSTLNRCLISLVSLLQRSRALKSVIVTLKVPGPYKAQNEHKLRALFYPLARLAANKTCTFEGIDQIAGLRETIAQDAVTNATLYARNLLLETAMLENERTAYRGLLEFTTEVVHKRAFAKVQRLWHKAEYLPFDCEADEQVLQAYIAEALTLFETAYEEVKGMLEQGAGFWIRAAKKFETAHLTRVQYLRD